MGDLLLHDGILYVTVRGLSVFALSADTGEVKWEADLSDGFVGSADKHAGRLVHFGRTLFVATGTDETPRQYVHALDHDTGEERWTFGAREFLWVAGVVDDVTYFSGNYLKLTRDEAGASRDPTGEGRIRALSLTDGTVHWQKTVPNLRKNNAIVAEHGIYAADGPVLRAFSLSGAERWSVNGTREYPTIAIAGSSILFEGADRATLAAYATESGDQKWTVPLWERWNVVMTPTRIYADSHDVKSDNVAALTHDGAELWRNRDGGTLEEFLLASDPLYVNRSTSVAALSPTNGTERWSFDPADEEYVIPEAVVDSGLIVELGIDPSDEFFLLDADTGEPRARITTSYRFFRTISRGERVYIGSEGRVYAFDVVSS